MDSALEKELRSEFVANYRDRVNLFIRRRLLLGLWDALEAVPEVQVVCFRFGNLADLSTDSMRLSRCISIKDPSVHPALSRQFVQALEPGLDAIGALDFTEQAHEAFMVAAQFFALKNSEMSADFFKAHVKSMMAPEFGRLDEAGYAQLQASALDDQTPAALSVSPRLPRL